MTNWRPEGLVNPYKCKGDCFSYQLVEPSMHEAFEVGVDALWDALWKLAEASPTKTFTIDANEHAAYGGNDV